MFPSEIVVNAQFPFLYLERFIGLLVSFLILIAENVMKRLMTERIKYASNFIVKERKCIVHRELSQAEVPNN